MASADTRFKPGVSGNPGGRPKGGGVVTALRREVTDEEVARWFVAVARGEHVGTLKPKLAEVQDARKWIADRMYGKAVDHKPVEEGDPLELSNVAVAIDKVVDELAGKRATRTTRPATNGNVAGGSTNGDRR